MKNFIKKIVLFIPILFITYIFFLIVLSNTKIGNLNLFNKEKGHMFNRLQQADSLNSLDILFLGSSHAYRGFDVEFFEKKGYTAFNLGSSNQSLLQSYILLDNYISKVNPKYVIIEVNPLSFCYDGDESNLDLLINTQKTSIEASILFHSPNLININTLVYKTITNKSTKEQKNEKPEGYYKGYIRKDSVFNIPVQKVTNLQRNLKESQIKYLDKTLSLLKKNKISYFLVYAPVTENFRKYYNNFPIDSIMKDKNFINFSDLENINDSLNFYDSHHMNQSGVNIFNEILIDTLKRNIFLNSKCSKKNDNFSKNEP